MAYSYICTVNVRPSINKPSALSCYWVYSKPIYITSYLSGHPEPEALYYLLFMQHPYPMGSEETLCVITTAHPWEVRMVHYLWSLRDIDQTLFIMYCVELTPVTYWIDTRLKEGCRYYILNAIFN